MARRPRIEFEGAFYHVITRGNQRQKIFKDKDDFLKYLEILFNYKIRYKYFLYAYVLMGREWGQTWLLIVWNESKRKDNNSNA